jgi:penicillin-binding protein 1A
MATTRTRDPRSPGPPDGRPPAGGTSGRKRKKKRNPWIVGLQYFVTYVLILILTAALALALGVAYELKQLPSSVTDIENLQPAGRTLVYSSDGVILASLFNQNRQTVTIDKIPLNLQHATVAIEDDRFYSNNAGFDIRGISRALFHNIQGGDMTGQGGSTITQQLVRNLGIGGIGHEKTFARKFREIIYAQKIEANYSKDQILEMYLNQVYYGSGAYGVQAAAETYFGKTVDKLDLAQCAMIAGLVQRPSRLSPYIDKQAAIARRDVVLDRMQQLGYIDANSCAQADAEPIILAFPKPPTAGSKTYYAPYFVDYVVNQLSQIYGTDMIYRGGLKIETTLNLGMQQAAEQAVEDGVANNKYLGATDAALIAMEPQTGYIKAMVGGVDYKSSQYNIAAFGRRQPGSSFKPVIYTAAIDSGLITENTPILDEPITLPGAAGPWSPKNDDGVFHGWVTARKAFADSINVPAVKVLRLVGVQTAIEYATMMGIKSPLMPYLTLALGASAVTPLEMATMYSMIDNKGERPTPIAIEKIEQSDGTILEDNEPNLVTTSIKPDALAQIDDMMRAVVTEGTASLVFADGNPPGAHGKTGTTQNHKDVWFDGYVPKLTCVVWAGHPAVDPQTGKPTFLPMHGEAWGATICAPIWKQFMVAALKIEAAQAAKDAPKPPPTPTAPKATTTAITTASSPAEPAKQKAAAATAAVVHTDPDDPGAILSSDGKTVKVWVDGDTGLRTSPNAPGSQQQSFAIGTEPMSYADGSQAGAASGNGPSDSSTSGSPTSSSSDSSAQSVTDTGQSGAAAQTSTPSDSDSDQPTAPVGTPVTTSIPAPASGPKMVTVEICVESGKRATEWCPETIEKQFPADKVPGYCTIHKPPPGE